MQFVDFVCPICRGPLQRQSDAYVCTRDRRSYPVRFGIPDFRIDPDHPVLSPHEEDLLRRMITEYSSVSFDDLMQFDPGQSLVIPPSLRTKKRVHIETGIVRGKDSLEEIQGLVTLPDRGRFLEIGCGPGGFLVAATEIFHTVVGLDINPVRLVLAKKRLDEANRQAVLVCGCAEYLPFPEGVFHLVVGADVIEHVKDPVQVMDQTHRVLAPGGAVFLATPNRWSLTPEPHVNVWGVGFLPKTWRERYVELMRHLPYRDISLFNWFELRRLLSRTRFARWKIILPTLLAGHITGLPAWARIAVPFYHGFKDFALTKWAVYLFGPLFHVICQKGKNNIPFGLP